MKIRRRDTETTVFFTAATAGSGVVRPRSRESPFAPRIAKSITSSESMEVAQWSTVPSVRPRTRPPRMITVRDGAAASTPAEASDDVTTVNCRSLATSCSATSCGVNPSSRKTVSASPSWSTAAAAIRRFSATQLPDRCARLVSKPALSTG